MDIVFNVPLNRVSFGQTSINILKAAKKQGHRVLIIPIGPIDLSTSNVSDEFKFWLTSCIEDASLHLDPSMKSFKLWHLATADEYIGFKGCYERYTDNCTLMSFYELDAPTQLELNVARQFDTVFSSHYSCAAFDGAGVKTRFVPLGFDKENFSVTGKKYFNDDRITFAILGKFENRKHHPEMIKSWVKRFGNDKRYYLQCAVYNPFFNPQMNSHLLINAMGNKRYWNVNPINWLPTNQAYNDFLNSNDIVLGMSGGEGWGLPEFHSVGLGKHAVILNAHAYKEWATEENSVLIAPLNKISAVDGAFFKQGIPINQGNIFSWDEDEFIAGCETAVKRYKTCSINTAGLKLQDVFSYEKTLNAILQMPF